MAPGDGRRGSNTGISGPVNQQHAKYKVTSGFTKSSVKEFLIGLDLMTMMMMMMMLKYFYQGLISTAGYCKFSAWKRETEIPRQVMIPFPV